MGVSNKKTLENSLHLSSHGCSLSCCCICAGKSWTCTAQDFTWTVYERIPTADVQIIHERGQSIGAVTFFIWRNGVN